jgi:hypothetical protein
MNKYPNYWPEGPWEDGWGHKHKDSDNGINEAVATGYCEDSSKKDVKYWSAELNMNGSVGLAIDPA